MTDRKKTYEIEVIDFFDGQVEASEVFAGLIAYDLSRNGRIHPFRRGAKKAVAGENGRGYNEGENQNLHERPDCALSQKDERGEGYGN